jgi:RNA polymerase sigma-70 factor (ECF subfamily)
MEAWCQGDTNAFEALFARVAPRIGAMLLHMTRDRALADDLVQVTFLKVHRARDAYQKGAPVMPWISAIARRTFLDAHRARRRSRITLTHEGDLPEPEPSPPEGDALGQLSDSDQKLLQDTIEALPPQQREALHLLKVQGLSLKEAAAVTGATVGAIKLRAHRAYEALRRVLGARGVGPTKTDNTSQPPTSKR